MKYCVMFNLFFFVSVMWSMEPVEELTESFVHVSVSACNDDDFEMVPDEPTLSTDDFEIMKPQSDISKLLVQVARKYDGDFVKCEPFWFGTYLNSQKYILSVSDNPSYTTAVRIYTENEKGKPIVRIAAAITTLEQQPISNKDTRNINHPDMLGLALMRSYEKEKVHPLKDKWLDKTTVFWQEGNILELETSVPLNDYLKMFGIQE